MSTTAHMTEPERAAAQMADHLLKSWQGAGYISPAQADQLRTGLTAGLQVYAARRVTRALDIYIKGTP